MYYKNILNLFMFLQSTKHKYKMRFENEIYVHLNIYYICINIMFLETLII